jgi:5-methylthioadenosine/S-adenosylhomocysteine deaminase
MHNKQTADTLLHARWVLPVAPKNIVLEQHSVAIKAGRIAEVLPTEQAKQRWQGLTELDLSEHALIPGLINAHAHTPMNLFRGLADDLPLMEWLNQHIWPAELAIYRPESIADGMRLAILEMLASGTTCFCDHFFFHDTAAQTVIETGMRANIGLWIGNVPTVWGKNETEYFAKAETSLQQNKPHPLVSWSLAPHSPYMVTYEAFQKIKQMSAEFNLPIHIHMHESTAEIAGSLKKYNKRPLEWLDELGLLSSRFICVHMVQLTPSEIELVAARQVPVVHSPESNLKLANGFAPITALLAAGVTVALGTDGAASNNDLNMFGEMRTAALLAKGVSQSATALPAPQALEMATINGAKAFGLDKEIGSLEIGKAADIVAVDLSSYFTQPVYNPLSHLVYAINRQQVSDVWVAGKQLLKNGEFTELDAAAIIAKAKHWAKQALPFRSQAGFI